MIALTVKQFKDCTVQAVLLAKSDSLYNECIRQQEDYKNAIRFYGEDMNNMETQIENYKKQINLYKTQIDAYDEKILLCEKNVRKQKVITWCLTGLSAILTIIAIAK